MFNKLYLDQATNLHFRGGRVFRAIIDDLLAKGMINAKNVLQILLNSLLFSSSLSCPLLWWLNGTAYNYRLFSLVVRLEDWLLFFNVIISILSYPPELMWNALQMLVTSLMRKHHFISSISTWDISELFHSCWCLVLTKQEDYFRVTTHSSIL